METWLAVEEVFLDSYAALRFPKNLAVLEASLEVPY